MAARKLHGAAAPGASTPTSDEASAGRRARGFDDRDNGQADFASAPRGAHALKVIEGETKARDYLARLQAQQADPDELALIVAALYGAVLRGFCAAITKALRGGGA